jgi:Protein of unknown function (DUF4058)
MDPYLEGSLWQSVHFQLATEIARQLAPKLRPRYLALTPERFVYEVPEAVPHVSVEIRDAANRLLVTAIEVLSPTNKRGDGRAEYLAKRQRLLRSTAHLVEIDLLREGQRVPMMRPLPSAPYFILVGRADVRPDTDVWPVRLDEPLPPFPYRSCPGILTSCSTCKSRSPRSTMRSVMTSLWTTVRRPRCPCLKTWPAGSPSGSEVMPCLVRTDEQGERPGGHYIRLGM